MDSRIWEIVFYLMDNLRSTVAEPSSFSELSGDLRSLGYSEDEISSAYSWMLDNVSGSHGVVLADLSNISPWHRILTPAERSRFTAKAYSHLIARMHSGEIDGQTLEELLDRVEFLGTMPVDVDQLESISDAIESEFPEQFYSDTSLDLVN